MRCTAPSYIPCLSYYYGTVKSWEHVTCSGPRHITMCCSPVLVYMPPCWVVLLHAHPTLTGMIALAISLFLVRVCGAALYRIVAPKPAWLHLWQLTAMPTVATVCRKQSLVSRIPGYSLPLLQVMTPNNDVVLRDPSLMMVSWIWQPNAFDSAIKSIQLPVNIGP